MRPGVHAPIFGMDMVGNGRRAWVPSCDNPSYEGCHMGELPDMLIGWPTYPCGRIGGLRSGGSGDPLWLQPADGTFDVS